MLLRDVLKPALSCTEATGLSVEECVACARSARHRYVAAGCGSSVRPTIGRILPTMPPTTPAPLLSANANLSPPTSTAATTGGALGNAVDCMSTTPIAARRNR